MKYDFSSKTNRFAERTLTNFSETLFNLLENKAFEEITVNELCGICNYPRATFYNYFDDIFDLLNWCWFFIGKKIQIEDYKELPPNKRTQMFFDRIYSYLDKERNRINLIMQHNDLSGRLIESLKKYMFVQAKAIMWDCPEQDKYPVPFEMITAHYSNTLQLVMEWCFFRKENFSKEQAEQSINYLLGSLERKEAL